jgi:hypothetical protein
VEAEVVSTSPGARCPKGGLRGVVKGKGGTERARTLTHPPTYETGDPTDEKGRGVSKKGTARRGEKISTPKGAKKFSTK